jgi:hemolysin activation/secretion protein
MGENFYYVAGQGEKSYKINKLYIFGQITGASAFSMASGYYTYQEAMGKMFYKISDDILITSRIRQQSVWNWSALRQLILDNDNGLRGYSVNDLSGNNRLIMNTELRTFPDFELWTFKFSGVAFWDIGSVWNQKTEIFKAKWHNSLGLGIRFFNMKGHGEDSIFRLDFAFNFSEMKFGGIIFTTDQLFSVFEKHQYKLPQVYGLEFDYQ